MKKILIIEILILYILNNFTVDFMNLMSQNEIFLLEEIVKKNFAAKYKDSVLGIVWSVLKPLLMMIILTIIFSSIFKGMVENYPVYLLSARCIYDFFMGAVNVNMIVLKRNKNIFQKTFVPKYIFILGGVISEFLNFIISFIILLGVMYVTNNPFHLLIMPLSIIPVISVIIMVLGLGFLFSILYVYYTDTQHLWSVISLMIMYSSAIFYPMAIIPQPYRQILELNPLFWIIDQFRAFIAYGTIPDLIYILNSLLLSTIILIIGIIVFKKYESRITIKL